MLLRRWNASFLRVATRLFFDPAQQQPQPQQ
jgi:hypothetical protein